MYTVEKKQYGLFNQRAPLLRLLISEKPIQRAFQKSITQRNLVRWYVQYYAYHNKLDLIKIAIRSYKNVTTKDRALIVRTDATKYFTITKFGNGTNVYAYSTHTTKVYFNVQKKRVSVT